MNICVDLCSSVVSFFNHELLFKKEAGQGFLILSEILIGVGPLLLYEYKRFISKSYPKDLLKLKSKSNSRQLYANNYFWCIIDYTQY